MTGAQVVAAGVGYTIDGNELLIDVTFSVAAGELVALVGPNGAGKSTMLAVLAGDLRPTTGSASVAGRGVDSWAPRELARVRAVMLQQHAAQFAYTVTEIVELGRAPHVVEPDRDRELVTGALAEADIAALADREITTLSGGELARVVFARVLAQDTPVVLLDEPTAALDLHHTELVMAALRRRAASGRSIVVVLHDLNLAARYADRVLMFSRGRLIADDVPERVLTVERIADVYHQRVILLDHPESGRPLVVPAG